MNTNEATELELYAANDSQFYFAYVVPTLDNLAKHLKRGIFNRDLAERSFLRVATQAAKHYTLEHGSMNDRFDRLFPMSSRRECASILFDRYKEDVEERAGITTAQAAAINTATEQAQ